MIFKLLLNILISLEKPTQIQIINAIIEYRYNKSWFYQFLLNYLHLLVMLILSLLEPFIHGSLDFLSQSIHLILLLLNELCLNSNNFLMSHLHVLLALLLLHLLTLDLNLMSLCILLLSGKLHFNCFQVKKLSWLLECHGQRLL